MGPRPAICQKSHCSTSARVGGNEAADLLGEIEQYRTRLEERERRATAGRLVVDDGGYAVVGRDREEPGAELLTAAEIHRDHAVRKLRLLEEQLHLESIGRGPVVEIDHAAQRAAAIGTG